MGSAATSPPHIIGVQYPPSASSPRAPTSRADAPKLATARSTLDAEPPALERTGSDRAALHASSKRAISTSEASGCDPPSSSVSLMPALHTRALRVSGERSRRPDHHPGAIRWEIVVVVVSPAPVRTSPTPRSRPPPIRRRRTCRRSPSVADSRRPRDRPS